MTDVEGRALQDGCRETATSAAFQYNEDATRPVQLATDGRWVLRWDCMQSRALRYDRQADPSELSPLDAEVAPLADLDASLRAFYADLQVSVGAGACAAADLP